ncbi:hypothetical protein GGS20DRAFT_562117 [Poronia punctata]|nr:hypothetical protein GGS20DRAFT_562117 [Poronia punctata]
MPTDYSISAAQALSLPTTPSSESPPPHMPSPNAGLPPWAQTSPNTVGGRGSTESLFGRPRPHGMRRLSTPYSRTSNSADNQPFGNRVMQGSVSVLNKLLKLGYSMTPKQRAMACVAGIATLALAIVFLVFSHRIFAALGPVAEGWRALPGGWILLFLLSCATAFPPMIGYSTTLTIAGFVYGFPGGWPIVAAATVIGSTASFFASRTVLSGYVHRLVGEDRRFVALGQVLRRDGLPVLAAIRFCPLPYSLSNGFLATIPSISPGTFVLATALSTPKLFIHIFIGDRLAQLAENDDMPTSTRIINYLSILLGSILGIAVGWFVYQRTMRRAKEIALEEAAATGGNSALRPDEFEYDDDVEEGIVGSRRSGENDAAALMDDDDISLWDSPDGVLDTYRDEDDADSGPDRTSGEGASRHVGVQ